VRKSVEIGERIVILFIYLVQMREFYVGYRKSYEVRVSFNVIEIS
jgi:hypothetical protein